MDFIVDFVYQQDWEDIIFTATAFVVTFGIHFFIRNKVHKTAERLELNKTNPLPDIIHLNISKYDTGKHTDYIIRYMVTGFALVCIIFTRIDIILCFLKIYLILKNFRTICISVTILPDITGGGKNTWVNGATNDLMFSGHVLLSTLLERFYVTYFVREEVFWLPSLFNIAIMINTIITRRHYTLDVLMAWYITYSFFHIYSSHVTLPPGIDYMKVVR